MTTIGYVLIGLAILFFRAVWQGRVMHLPEDLGTEFTAALTGNFAQLKATLALKGDDLTPATVGADPSTGNIAGVGSNLLSEAEKLGAAAGNRYVFGTTGPNSYDCSGLVWRSAKNIQLYTGARFTTHTFAFAAHDFCTPVDSPQVGDIVVWLKSVSGHMGIVSGKDQFYSARNARSGIGTSTISTWPDGAPKYYRPNSIVPYKNGSQPGTYGNGLGVDL